MADILETEMSRGNIVSYEISEPIYEEHFLGPEAGWYNVSCVYQVDYGSNDKIVYSARIEKKFLCEIDDETSEYTLKMVNYHILDEQLNAPCSYPSYVSYSPQIPKKM